MKAVFITEHGGTDKLVYGDRPEPEIAPVRSSSGYAQAL